jgi:uroporphyrin-3 C-methyltransferase
VLGLLALLALLGLWMAWTTQQRVQSLEQELVRRAQDSQRQATEARLTAGQAQDSARDSAAKTALLEARLAETTLQRSQVEELIGSLSRSRDETMLADIEVAIRVALQQSAITGSAEPLVATLKQAEERLARNTQPQLARVRRALARDLDRVKALGVTDVSALTLKLDEVVRLVDDLPLLAVAVPRPGASPSAVKVASKPAGAASQPVAAGDFDWRNELGRFWRQVSAEVWDEVRSLVRVTRIEHPEAMLVAPEQAYFVRENLKLRLLNARLALLSRQFDTAQSDLRDAQSALDRYFDRSARRVGNATDLVRQVASQARQTSVPRPDETLSALAAAAAGR